MTHPKVTPAFLAAARGDAPADLLLTRARIFDVFSCRIVPGSVALHGSRIAAVLPPGQSTPAHQVIDLEESFVTPGLIDAHMHVESTMLPPSAFVELASPHGTTGVVLDPHEIANVLGVAGIRAIMEDARGLPMDIRFALSSCVPSCDLETSGARLEAADLEPLFDDPRVVALAEMMNYPGVIAGDERVLAKVNLGLARRMVDGHAPGLRGRALQAYIAAGISSDHECTTLAEAQEKLGLGMRIFVREGSAARNLEALIPLITPASRTRFCLCTDDRHPADLLHDGHIDHAVRRAVGLGLDPATAVAMGSFHTAQHYGMVFRGAVAPGYHADLVVVDDPRTFRPRLVFFEGRLVAKDGAFLPAGGRANAGDGAGDGAGASARDGAGANAGDERRATRFPPSGVRLPAGFDEHALRVAAPGAGPARVRVIGVRPGQIVTDHLVLELTRRDGAVHADPGQDVLKAAIVERHRGGGNIGLGFVRGFGLVRGALGSTVGHDAHNLALLGVDDHDMVVAARALEQAGGGQCVVAGGRVLALLPLPIAGLMSDLAPGRVIEQQAALLRAAHDLGCPLEDPFMPLSFVPLPVIPSLKLTDLGLVDVERFSIVPLLV